MNCEVVFSIAAFHLAAGEQFSLIAALHKAVLLFG